MTQKLSREAFDAATANKRPKKGVQRDSDTLKNQFGIDSSPIRVEVKKSQDVTIDLDHPTTVSSA